MNEKQIEKIKDLIEEVSECSHQVTVLNEFAVEEAVERIAEAELDQAKKNLLDYIKELHK